MENTAPASAPASSPAPSSAPASTTPASTTPASAPATAQPAVKDTSTGIGASVKGTQPASGTPAVTEGKESVADPNAPEVKPEDLFELTINGQKVFKTREELIASAQRYIAGDNKLRQAHEQQMEFATKLKTDPWSVLQSHGFDQETLDKLAHDRLAERVKWENMTPEEREFKLERDKFNEEREYVRQQQAQINEFHSDRIQNDISNDMMSVLPTYTDLPQTQETVLKILDKLDQALDLGHRMTVKQATELVHKEFHSNRKFSSEWLKSAPPEVIIETLGEDKIKELMTAKVGDLKQQAIAQRSGSGQSLPSNTGLNEPQKHMSTREWLEQRKQQREIERQNDRMNS